MRRLLTSFDMHNAGANLSGPDLQRLRGSAPHKTLDDAVAEEPTFQIAAHNLAALRFSEFADLFISPRGPVSKISSVRAGWKFWETSFEFSYETPKLEREKFSFPLVTSIPPTLSGANLERQKRVIESWRSAGFEPYSVNGPSEIKRLICHGLDIEYLQTEQEGKPRIADMVRAIRHMGVPHGGLINADCEIIPVPNMARALRRVLKGSFLYAERVDVGSEHPALGECQGFDAFFFDTATLSNIDDKQLRLGETWWDYWLPLQAAINNAQLWNIDVPLLIHERHAARWSYEQWLTHARLCWDFVSAAKADGRIPAFLSSISETIISETPSNEYLSVFAAACFQTLRSRSRPTEQAWFPHLPRHFEHSMRSRYRALQRGERRLSKNFAARSNIRWRLILRNARRIQSLIGQYDQRIANTLYSILLEGTPPDKSVLRRVNRKRLRLKRRVLGKGKRRSVRHS